MNLVQTGHGLVGLTPPKSQDAARPVVLVIRGLSAGRQLAELAIPGADVAFIDLPGYRAPTFPTYSIEGLAEAFDDVVALSFPGRSLVLLGVSVGAVIALNMRPANAIAVVAIEPFLRTAHLWPLQSWASRASGEVSRFLGEALGFHPNWTDPKAFAIRTAAPVTAIVGSEPLGSPRRLPGIPSLCDAVDRRGLRESGAKVVEVTGGHDVPTNHPETIRNLVAEQLQVFSHPNHNLTR